MTEGRKEQKNKRTKEQKNKRTREVQKEQRRGGEGRTAFVGCHCLAMKTAVPGTVMVVVVVMVIVVAVVCL